MSAPKVRDSRRFVLEAGDGKTTTIEFDYAALDVTDDLDREASGVAATHALVVTLLSQASENYAVADAEYRRWRAMKANEVNASQEGKALAEWRVKDAIEADPRFLEHKKKIARIGADIEFLRNYLDSLRTKVQAIRIRTDLAVRQLGAGGYGNTPGRDGGRD